MSKTEVTILFRFSCANNHESAWTIDGQTAFVITFIRIQGAPHSMGKLWGGVIVLAETNKKPSTTYGLYRKLKELEEFQDRTEKLQIYYNEWVPNWQAYKIVQSCYKKNNLFYDKISITSLMRNEITQRKDSWILIL